MQVSTKSPIIMAGRGARFLDLVRQNKLNVSPQLSKRRLSIQDFFTSQSKELENSKTKNKALEEKDYLKFSSTLKYNPDASPSSSILSKRKLEADSSPLSNSAAKRKRVGFSDPVSSTKEYLIEDGEERSKSCNNSLIRCLTYEINAEDDDEGENAEENDVRVKEEEATDEAVLDIKVEIEELNVEPFIKDHDYEKVDSPQLCDITTSEDSMQSANEGKLVFNGKKELMEYITKNLSIDELFDKLTQAEEESLKRKELIAKVIKTVGFEDLLKNYFPLNESEAAKMSAEQSALISGIASELSKLMQSNNSVKHKVLDILSEKHSEEFLDHSLQENSTSRVCEKITIHKIVNYLIHKVNVSDSDEDDDLLNKMSRSMMHHLIENTHKPGRQTISDPKETEKLLKMLFKNKPKMETFDTVQEFVRNLLQNH